MESNARIQREQLLRSAVVAGNEDAWRSLYVENFDELYAYVRWRCGGRRDSADEIVQETWLIAVRKIRRFDPLQGSFIAWLCGIAANVLRNELRRQRTLDRHRQAMGEQATDAREIQPGAAESQEDSARIAAALDALPERHEAVLRAKYLDDLSVAQIASAWNQTPKSIESLLSRARRMFRQLYESPSDNRQPEGDCHDTA